MVRQIPNPAISLDLHRPHYGMPMVAAHPQIHAFLASELGNTSYLVADPDSGEAVAIDPFRDVEQYLAAADQHNLRVRHTLDTHLHNDFVSGSRELRAAAGAGIEPLLEGGELAVGRWRLRALHTPGHTPDHLSYLLSDADGRPHSLFSGGSLMVGAIGRTDLFGPHNAVHLALEAFRTLKVRLRSLPDDVRLFPTHGGGSFCASATTDRRESTLGEERQTNPFLTTNEMMPFIARALHQGRYPDYYRGMADLNRRGAPILGRTLPPIPDLKPHQVETFSRERKAAILDVRSGRDYDRGHISGSYNIGLEGPFSAWVGWLIESYRPLILAGGTTAEHALAQRQLLRIGYDNVIGALDGGMDAWSGAGLPLSTFETAEIEDLAIWILSAEPMTVVDARAEEEWVHGHVPGSLHMYVPDVAHHSHEIPREAPVAVHCGVGYRAGIACSLLEQAGLRRIIHVIGPYSDWDRLHLASTIPG